MLLFFSGGIMENLTEQLQKNAFDKQENLEVTLFERVIGDQVHLCFHSLVKQTSIILGLLPCVETIILAGVALLHSQT